MTLRSVALALGALLLSASVGYGAGRYTAPAKIETRTVTEVQTRVEWKDRVVEKVVQGPVRTVTHTVERLVACAPGETTPERETTTTVDAGPVVAVITRDDAGTVAETAKTETVRIVTTEQPRLMLQAGGSLGLDMRPEWSAGASYRLVGPVWFGAAYQSSQRVEARVSLTF